MRIEFNSPKALAYQIIAGITVTMGGFLLLMLPTRQPHRPHNWLIALPVILGIITSFTGESSLTRGAQKKKWPKEQLIPIVRWFSHPLLLVPVSLVAIWYVVYLFVSHFHRGLTGFWLAFFPLLTCFRVRIILKSAATDVRDDRLSLQNAKPIQSESWGVPRQV